MTIYEFLKKEHKEAGKLLKKAHSTWSKDPKKSKEIFETVKQELIAHTKAEEECFYMPLRERACSGDDDCLALEGKEEHHMIALMLKELSNVECHSAVWLAKLNVLTEMVEHHVKEEESDIFKQAKKHFSTQEATEIYAKMKVLKSSYLKQVEPLMEQEVQLVVQPSLDFNQTRVIE